ncbi:MAG: DNA adenine methylase [Terriglobales bacterium]|jgi:DNA adenine methylase
MRFGDIPHPIPYQGSKRQLAPLILSFIPAGKFERMFEPFVGSGAVTLAAARKKVCKKFVVSDKLEPLCGIWGQIVNNPKRLADEYSDLWERQFPDSPAFFNRIRDEFNEDRSPAKLLFLLARCVKNAVRFNPSGQFNQSADKRRLGTKPKTMRAEIEAAHRLLLNKCEVRSGDYKTVLSMATPEDIVYMDPPYQGTSEGRDSRYFKGVPRDDLISMLKTLNRRGVQFVLSYDGACGDKTYGEVLPGGLRLKRVLVDAGRSSQATLNGKSARTVESLYLSARLADSVSIPSVVHPKFTQQQAALFEQV